jgi:ribosomal protein S18 acetylase RimI-like enzyme
MIHTLDTIDYAPLAQMPGLTFRPWRDQGDFLTALEIYNEERVLNKIDLTFTVKDFEDEVKWYENFDITQQYIFAEYHGKPIGYFNFNWESEGSGRYLLFLGGSLLPEYYQETIGSCMLRYAEEKLREMALSLPEDRQKRYRTWYRLANQAACGFFQQNGYQIERYFFKMRRPIELPLGRHLLPEGIEIRPAQPEHYHAVWEAEQEAFQDHWGYTPPLPKHFEMWQEDNHFQPRYWKVAWDTQSGEVAGMVRGFHKPEEDAEFHRKRGYTENISVRRPWRGKGLAKALIAESILMFQQMGMEETFLNVDATNPTGALNLYRAMGYEELPDQTVVVMDKILE